MSGFFRLAGDKAGYRSGTVRTGGFTLLEAMIVVLLFSIFSALAIPNSIRFMRNMRLNAAVNGVKKQLQLARMRALADPFKHCGVYFQMLPDSQYTQMFIEAVENNGRFDDPRTGGNDMRYLAEQRMPAGIEMQWDTAPAEDVFVFRGDGSAKFSGVVAISDGYRTRRLNVLASTGRIKME